jgi:hypothetical protein
MTTPQTAFYQTVMVHRRAPQGAGNQGRGRALGDAPGFARGRVILRGVRVERVQ